MSVVKLLRFLVICSFGFQVIGTMLKKKVNNTLVCMWLMAGADYKRKILLAG